eukprot:CAMPEP_0184308342 /NCGR_PEP_ID=MMETSP1049-20130417/16821_1 /TAXON_ID=77928 /ORGANISM="Proteomonas sulcata, Strain CCMP704" /LENGTH=66 /DNA_ID=CAMNT_0026621001 /DNA_START=107 /DNA_END=307 /DNA_ORIENTATION=+
MIQMENWKECLNDGLHFSDQGNKVMFDNLMGMMGDKLDLATTTLPAHFPLHADIPEQDPATLLRQS